jgi:hypothetical protein
VRACVQNVPRKDRAQTETSTVRNLDESQEEQSNPFPTSWRDNSRGLPETPPDERQQACPGAPCPSYANDRDYPGAPTGHSRHRTASCQVFQHYPEALVKPASLVRSRPHRCRQGRRDRAHGPSSGTGIRPVNNHPPSSPILAFLSTTSTGWQGDFARDTALTACVRSPGRLNAWPTWWWKLLIHEGGAGAFACEPVSMGLLTQAANDVSRQEPFRRKFSNRASGLSEARPFAVR